MPSSIIRWHGGQATNHQWKHGSHVLAAAGSSWRILSVHSKRLVTIITGSFLSTLR